jgi:hypothetical protein
VSESKVAREVCEAEFTRFADAMGLDLDQSHMDDDDKKSFREMQHRVFRAMERGLLVIDEKGQAVYRPEIDDGQGPLTFREPTGATFLSMDMKKAGHDQAKMMTFLGDITGQPPARFAKMMGRDLKVCQALLMLFLG